MRKRQFGKGKPVIAAEHNEAQNYGIFNLQEAIQDMGLYGIISGALCTSSNDGFYVDISPTVARDYVGNRIAFTTQQKVSAQPSASLLSNQEVWVTLYAIHDYVYNESDIDEDDVLYYKDWGDTYTILKLDGVPDTIGTAQRPTIPANGILLCDVLVSGVMSLVTNGDIYTNRQILFTDTAGTSLTLSGDLTVYGTAGFHQDINLNSNKLRGVSAPTADDEVGDRGYNDNRYVNVTGDVMSGALETPHLTTIDTSTGTLGATGNANIGGRLTVGNGIISQGNSVLNGELYNIGQIIATGQMFAGDNITGASLTIPWQSNKLYYQNALVVAGNKLYQAKDTHVSNSSGDFYLDIHHWFLAGGGGGGTSFDITLDNHGFSVGEVLRYDTTIGGNYVRAIADDYEHLGMFVVSAVADENNFTIMSSGYLEGLPGLTPNQWYYLSDTSTGALTSTSPLLSQPILFSTSTSTGYVFSLKPSLNAEVYDDYFITTHSQTQFTLTRTPPGKAYVTLSLDGAVQDEDSFDLSGNVLETLPLPAGVSVRVQYVSSMSIPTTYDTITIFESDDTPPSPDDNSKINMYFKNDKLIVQYNDGGTIKYRFMVMTSTGSAWGYSETEP